VLSVLLLASPAVCQDVARGDFAAARFSTLDEIDAGNVARLSPAFSFQMPAGQGFYGTPQVAGRTLL